MVRGLRPKNASLALFAVTMIFSADLPAYLHVRLWGYTRKIKEIIVNSNQVTCVSNPLLRPKAAIRRNVICGLVGAPLEAAVDWEVTIVAKRPNALTVVMIWDHLTIARLAANVGLRAANSEAITASSRISVPRDTKILAHRMTAKPAAKVVLHAASLEAIIAASRIFARGDIILSVPPMTAKRAAKKDHPVVQKAVTIVASQEAVRREAPALEERMTAIHAASSSGKGSNAIR